jgi:hypothetical protein
MTGFIDTSLQLQSIITADTLNSFWTTSLWRVLYEESLTNLSLISDWSLLLLELSLSLSLTLRPTVSRPVSLGIKHPSGASDQIFITVGQLRVCWCGALSLTRGRGSRLQLLLVLFSAVILGSKPLGTRDHILLSQIWGFRFHRLLRLAGSRLSYSTPPPYGYYYSNSRIHCLLKLVGGQNRSHYFQQFVLFCFSVATKRLSNIVTTLWFLQAIRSCGNRCQLTVAYQNQYRFYYYSGF